MPACCSHTKRMTNGVSRGARFDVIWASVSRPICFRRNVLRRLPPTTYRRLYVTLTTDIWSGGVGVDRRSIAARQCRRQQPRLQSVANLAETWSLFVALILRDWCVLSACRSFRLPSCKDLCLKRDQNCQTDLTAVSFSRPRQTLCAFYQFSWSKSCQINSFSGFTMILTYTIFNVKAVDCTYNVKLRSLENACHTWAS